MPTNHKHTTATTAARKLDDILRWRLQAWQPPTPEPLRAIRYDKDSGGSITHPLPFPSDSVTTEGAAGVQTFHGIDTWIKLWGSALAWSLDLTPPKIDGPWLRKTLEENRELHPLPDPKAHKDDPETAAWAKNFLKDWDRFTKELNRLWWLTAKATGHAPLRRGLCPKCTQGWLQSESTPTGYTDQATCTNHQCGFTIDYTEAELGNGIRAALRAAHPDDATYLTLNQLRVVWPRIKESTLRWWVHQGHVRKHEGRYCLQDVNRRKHPTL